MQYPGLFMVILSVGLFVGGAVLKSSSQQHYTEQWTGHIARFFYFVGIPYLGVILGIITPRMLGFVGVEHLALIDWSDNVLSGQLQQSIMLMVLEWLFDVPASVVAGLAATLILIGLWALLKRYQIGLSLARISGVGVIYYGLHWAFYRAIFWQLTGDLYLGVVLGCILVVVESVLSVYVQKQSPALQQQFLVNSIILTLTATVFFYSPNWWLLFPLHLLMASITHSACQPARYPAAY